LNLNPENPIRLYSNRMERAVRHIVRAYPESVSILATGCSSAPASWLLRARSQSSRQVSFEKSASTAPARVPVAINDEAAPGDQAKVAVRGISLRRTMSRGVWCGGIDREWKVVHAGRFESRTEENKIVSTKLSNQVSPL
jgi:hypothetical protein